MTLLEEKEMTSKPRFGGGRTGLVALMIVSLVAMTGARELAMRQRASAMKSSETASAIDANVRQDGQSPLSSMPSFAIALLLGGLRGPLAMILWTSSENQKIDNDLQDLDTKIEWIRLLQPEFDTVHLFQIWNKAYNISVKMSSLSNKYTTILDALDYGQKMTSERPNDLNLICAVGSIYGDKLGQAAESAYYRRRVRHETQTLWQVSFPNTRIDEFRKTAEPLGWIEDESAIIQGDTTSRVLLEQAICIPLKLAFNGSDVIYKSDARHDERQDEVSWRRLRLDPIVDADGNIYEDLIKPVYTLPDPDGKVPEYDGSSYQFLKQYSPFKHGISTFAIAYNDFKRAELLMEEPWNEHPVQLGEGVIDSRPAIYLEAWAQDEWDRARRYEMRMWSQPVVTDPLADLDQPTANIPLTQAVVYPSARQAALDTYELSARLWGDSRKEMIRHLDEYAGAKMQLQSHLDDALGNERIMLADHDYILCNVPNPDPKMLQQCRDEYIAAEQSLAMAVLKYYVMPDTADRVYPVNPENGKRFSPESIERINPAEIMKTFQLVKQDVNQNNIDPATHQYSRERDQYADTRSRYEGLIARSDKRLAALPIETGGATTAPSTRPN